MLTSVQLAHTIEWLYPIVCWRIYTQHEYLFVYLTTRQFLQPLARITTVIRAFVVNNKLTITNGVSRKTISE